MVENMANAKIMYLKLNEELSKLIKEEAQRTGVTASGLMRMFIIEKLRERGVKV